MKKTGYLLKEPPFVPDTFNFPLLIARIVEIEVPIVVLLNVRRAGASIMKLNGKSRIIQQMPSVTLMTDQLEGQIPSRLRAMGYVLMGQRSIAEFIPDGMEFRPTLCISDTHLYPRTVGGQADDPDELLRLIRGLRLPQIFILGDFLESLPFLARSDVEFAASDRLVPLLGRLMKTRSLRIVLGNHDAYVVRYLQAQFGSERMIPGGFSVGNMRFAHGHEVKGDITPLLSFMGPLLLVLNPNKLPHNPFIGSNRLIVDAQSKNFSFYVFGHTHVPQIGVDFANLGSFLRVGIQSFLILNGKTLRLWGRWQQ